LVTLALDMKPRLLPSSADAVSTAAMSAITFAYVGARPLVPPATEPMPLAKARTSCSTRP
jgi:hypothetical protein